jgi:heat shock protein HslJ
MAKFAQLSFIVLMLFASACQGAREVSAESTSGAELHNTLWKLISLNGVPIQAEAGQYMASLTLDFQQSQARIVTACNRGLAGFTIDGSKIKFEIAMATKMMCPPELMKQEAGFFKAIRETTRYQIKGEMLELYTADNKLLATFHAEYLK